jgi:L,D-transpeptidase catalytic domain/Putative peptidoglycan binding domain
VRTKTFIAVAVALTALLILAGGVVAYDRAHKDQIAHGIVVGGVDVGGMTRAQATAKLDRAFVSGLRRTVVVRHGGDTWRLTAREARIVANVDATVDQALARSREGGLISRTVRGMTGGEVNDSLDPEVTYSDEAITRLIRRIRRAIDRDPVDAKVSFSASGISHRPSRLGLAVDAKVLHRRIREAIVSPTGKRRFGVKTHHTEPAVTDRKLARDYGTVLILNRGGFKLTLYKDLKPAKTYSVAVGAVGLETPAGLYHIQNKAVNPAWTKPHSDWVPASEQGDIVPGGTPENPLKARWMGIFDGAGIHGIDPSLYGTIGSAASHGCVRMRIPDVVELYDKVPVGAPIYIA